MTTMMNKSTHIPNFYWSGYGLKLPTSEYKFHPTRKWRFDYCWPENKLAVEIEGGIFTKGRHTRGVGFSNDMEKYNSAVLLGWRILRYAPQKINFDEIRTAFNQ
jgi:very-short-patch-repair endonuclease